MAHYCKCAVCNERFDRDVIQATRYNGNRYAHEKCFPNGELIPLAEKKPKTPDQEDLADLKDFINEKYGSHASWPVIMKQIKEYHDTDGYSYRGIKSTLRYAYDVLKMSPEQSNGGIGIVKFLYDKAYNHYYQIWLDTQRNKGKNIQDFLPKEDWVYINQPRSSYWTGSIKLFDMDWEDDEWQE